MEKYKFLEHTADVKFQVFGKSVERVFENSALALKEVICGKINVKGNKEKSIKIQNKNFESLLYNFLEEILFLLDAEDFLIRRVKKIKIKDFELTAVFIGDKASRYGFTNPVKAVTYNEMFVKQKGNEWIAQVVVDV